MTAGGSPSLLVVGGGPAGLATAVAARLEGFTVRVMDASTPPLDKACGEGLMPDAVANLRKLGVRLLPSDTAVFQGIRYIDGDRVAEARFPAGEGLGVRRTVLHEALRQRAKGLGVEMLWGRRATGFSGNAVETQEGSLAADWIVAADGLRSPMRRWAGLGGAPGKHQRFAVRRHYSLAPWSDLVEVYWGPGYEAYVTPVSAEELGVAFLWQDRKTSFDELLEGLPALHRRLRGAKVASRDRGCGPLHQRVKRVARGPLALVGDASGYLDAITGEGLALAFHQAFALVESLQKGGLRNYVAAHRRIARLPNAMTQILLFAERHPAVRRRLVGALKKEPEIFERFLGLHARSHRLRDVGWSGALRLARGFVAT